MQTDKTKITRKLNEVVRPYCQSNWCLLKEMMIHNGSEIRSLVQLKCIEHWKHDLSEKADHDVGWTIAHVEWVSSGCAKFFADNFNEDLTAEQIYEKIIAALHNKA